MRTHRIIGGTVLAAFLFACSGAAPEAEKKEGASLPPVPAATAVAHTAEVPRVVTVTGSLVAIDRADVSPDIAGKVKEVFVDRGSKVKKGDPLVQLDDRTLRFQAAEADASVGVARTQIDQAKIDCGRAESLAAIGGLSAAEKEKILAQCAAGALQLEAAQARKGALSTNLGNSVVRAPFDGMVTDRLIGVGEYVSPGRAVARLVSVDPLRLELSVPEREAGVVAIGAEVTFEVVSLPGEEFHAKIDRVSPMLRDRTRDRLVEAAVANPDGRLMPGSFAVARVSVGTAPALVVPEGAVVARGEDHRLFAVVDGVAEERVVELGARADGVVEIRKGIAENEPLVSPWVEGVVDGSPIQNQTAGK